MTDTFKKWTIRGLAVLGGLSLAGGALTLALWAYQGHQAFQVIQATIEQQRVQQGRQMPQARPEPPQAPK